MHMIKLSGSLCTDARPLARLPAGTVIIHGGGPQLDAALAASGPARRVQGLRVTSKSEADTVATTMDQVGDALAEQLRGLGRSVLRVAASDRAFGGTTLDDALGRVGAITDIGPIPVDDLTVVTPVAWDEEGPLNVNADDGACAIARAHGARTLTFLSDVPGVLDGSGNVLEKLDPAAAKACIDDGTARGGMIPKLQAAMALAEAGIDCRIGDVSCIEGTGGTTITTRPMRAAPDDALEVRV